MEATTESLGAKLKRAIEARGITQTKAAEQIGVAQTVMSQWVNEKRNVPEDRIEDVEAWLQNGHAPLTAESPATRYRDGIYEVRLDETCDKISQEIRALNGKHRRTGKAMRTMFTVERVKRNFQLQCPECQTRWWPLLPLRPDARTAYPDLHKKMVDSRHCAECAKKGDRVEGRRVKLAGSQLPVMRAAPQYIYLTADERAEVDRVLDPNRKPTITTETIPFRDGTTQTFQGLPTQKPLVHTKRDKWGAVVSKIEMRDMISLSYIGPKVEDIGKPNRGQDDEARYASIFARLAKDIEEAKEALSLAQTDEEGEAAKAKLDAVHKKLMQHTGGVA